MTDDRLSALCMMSLHRQVVNRDNKQFIRKVIDNFGSQSRRLQFVFGPQEAYA